MNPSLTAPSVVLSTLCKGSRLVASASLGSKNTWLLSCSRDKVKTLLGSEQDRKLYILRLHYCLVSLENSNFHVNKEMWSLQILVVPTCWYSSFLLFMRQSFESLWRALVNPVTGPGKAQTYNSQGPELTETSLRRPVAQQKSVAIRFCPHPVLRGTCPFPHLWQEGRPQTDLQTWVVYSVKGHVSHHQIRKAGHAVLQKPENILSDDFRIPPDITWSYGFLIRFDFSLHK